MTDMTGTPFSPVIENVRGQIGLTHTIQIIDGGNRTIRQIRHASAKAELRRDEMVTIAARSQVAGSALRQLWVLPEALTRRGFRPPDLSLRTEILPGGYQTQTHLSRAGIPITPARADRAGGDR